MKDNLLPLLICPVCRGERLSLEARARDDAEVRDGEVICADCGARMAIHNGILNTLVNPRDVVVAESQGWVTLLEVPEKRHEFTDAWLLALPFVRADQTPDPQAVRVWNQLGKHFFANLDRVDWRGKRVLEIGAGRCWGVAELARRGAYAVGLDIVARKYIGLESADVLLEAGAPFFERVLGDMHNLAFRAGAFDYVLTSSSLHHTHALLPALHEIARVLADDGRALFINEPVVPDDAPRPDTSDWQETQHNIIELRPTVSEWKAAFAAAGLGIVDVRIEDDMHALLWKGETRGYFPQDDPRGPHRGLRRYRWWREAEHRWWTAYDRVKARVLRG